MKDAGDGRLVRKGFNVDGTRLTGDSGAVPSVDVLLWSSSTDMIHMKTL